YRNWELIIVDDAGNDDAVKTVVDRFGDERIIYVRLAARAGNGQARNEGLARARGGVIAYLDDDDQWDPDNLLVLLHQMRDGGARAAYGAQLVWTGFDEATRMGREFKTIRFSPFNRSFLENANYISMISFIHEKRLLEEAGAFDASLHRFLDWDLFLRLT